MTLTSRTSCPKCGTLHGIQANGDRWDEWRMEWKPELHLPAVDGIFRELCPPLATEESLRFSCRRCGWFFTEPPLDRRP